MYKRAINHSHFINWINSRLLIGNWNFATTDQTHFTTLSTKENILEATTSSSVGNIKEIDNSNPLSYNVLLEFKIDMIFVLIVDGGWSDFGEWDNCTMPCDGGTTCRERKCNNPIPKNGGEECHGESQECKDCNTISCKGKHLITIE